MPTSVPYLGLGVGHWSYSSSSTSPSFSASVEFIDRPSPRGDLGSEGWAGDLFPLDSVVVLGRLVGLVVVVACLVLKLALIITSLLSLLLFL